MERQTDRWRDRQTDEEKERQIYGMADIQMKRQADR
jgi:hypothetical protein